jgi:RNA polymerase sigma-70 factor (ECF subfamily)
LPFFDVNTVKLPTDDLLPTRYSLLSRLQDWDDHASWKEFFDTYWRLIYSFALKSGLTDAEAQDVVQETIISVAKDIQKFERDRRFGSFKGWLRNLTRWRIADQLRKRQHASTVSIETIGSDSPGGGPPEFPVTPEVEKAWEDEWRANLMKVALENIKCLVKEEHFQMFDLYVLRQWPADQVAVTLGVSIDRVYLAKFRVAALLKKEIQRLENAELKVA